MCGRFTQTQSPQALAEAFGLGEIPAGLEARYNIAPTQWVAAVRAQEPGGKRQLTLLRWGLIPGWARDASVGARMINAKCETAAQKPAFREPFRRRRCLIPADGFFEWEKTPSERVPYYYFLKGHALFALAGLWDRWRHPGGETIESFTILTTGANALVAPVHDRMPVIVGPEHYGRWLDPAADVKALLAPYPAEAMDRRRVSARVNKPDEDRPDLIEPVSDPETRFL
ncbi:MAG: SOS response-associated peptidase [Candidatus Sumerlaeia bacterium]